MSPRTLPTVHRSRSIPPPEVGEKYDYPDHISLAPVRRRYPSMTGLKVRDPLPSPTKTRKGRRRRGTLTGPRCLRIRPLWSDKDLERVPVGRLIPSSVLNLGVGGLRVFLQTSPGLAPRTPGGVRVHQWSPRRPPTQRPVVRHCIVPRLLQGSSSANSHPSQHSPYSSPAHSKRRHQGRRYFDPRVSFPEPRYRIGFGTSRPSGPPPLSGVKE